ncbi:MAG: hypothetical protein L0I76_32195 [Pseudonocardia sp.]|nr:hypothetical protein [Pseudonocardia sp.]
MNRGGVEAKLAEVRDRRTGAEKVRVRQPLPGRARATGLPDFDEEDEEDHGH